MSSPGPGTARGIAASGDDPIAWIEANLDLRTVTSTTFLYEHMASQSAESLAIIYQPFDGRLRGHFADRGQILDFALVSGGGQVLDLGPGDGWPSLLIAPMVDQVTGVDASPRRVEVCRANADRLGIGNARFVQVSAGEQLPFEECAFDAVVAASSIEQTPDPEATLRELARVLRPGGRLRVHYEALGRYAGGRERDTWLMDCDGRTLLVLYDRLVDDERVRHFGLLFDLQKDEVAVALCGDGAGAGLSYGDVRGTRLEALRDNVVDAITWTTHHPSCHTLVRWLTESGFTTVEPTYDGGWFAGRLHDHIDTEALPRDVDDVDALLRPLVRIVTTMRAPVAGPRGAWAPWITATR